MNLSEAPGEFSMGGDDVATHNPSIDPLIVIAGAACRMPWVTSFTPPGCIAIASSIFEFKHYMRYGKKWTSSPGVDFVFAVPKKHINILDGGHPGHLCVGVGDLKFHFNLSCGTSGQGRGWKTWIGPVVNTYCSWTRRDLAKLGNWSSTAVELCGKMRLPVRRLTEEQELWWKDNTVRLRLARKLGKGSRVALASGWSYGGSRGPFVIAWRHRRVREYSCLTEYGRLVRVQWRAIDWIETAGLNGFQVPGLVYMNRIGEILKPEENT